MRIFVLFCVFLGGLGQGVVNPKLPELLSDHARLALDSGLSASLMYMGIFFASFVYGRLADRGKTFLVMAGGLLLYALVLALFVSIRSKELFFALRFFEGLALSAIYVSADVVLCRASNDSERGRWLSYYGVALGLGLLGGPAIVLGVELPTALRMLSGIVFVACLASLRLQLPLGPPETSNPMHNRGAALAAVLYGFLEAGLVAVLAAVVVTGFQARVENVFIALILSAALASIGWGILIDKIGGRRALRFVFLSFTAAISVVWGLYFFSGATWWLPYVASLAFGLAAGGIYPAGFAWLIEGSAPSQYGYASGLFTRAYGLGSLFGPLVFGLAVEGAGVGAFFGLSAALGLAGLACSSNVANGKAAS